MKGILKFDLTTLGFNVQNTLVPSRTLNWVPTVSFILEQSQVCISNGLEARALQRRVLICKNAILDRDCKTGKGKVFIQTNAISKRIKIELPD